MKIIGDSYLQLLPTCIARGKIIDIINKNGLYESNDFEEESIIKLCRDYSQGKDTNAEFSKTACNIVENLIIKRVKALEDRWYYSSKKTVCPLLSILYNLADLCKNWLDNYFDKLIQYFKGKNSHKKRFASDIARYTIRNTPKKLAKNNTEKLAELANQFWTSEDKIDLFHYSDYNESNKYGLNKNAENYRFDFRSPLNNLFYIRMLSADFAFAFDWTIAFINKAISNLFKNYTKDECTIQIQFLDDNISLDYYEADMFWLMGIQEHNGNMLLSDMLFLLRNFLIENLGVHKGEKDIFVGLAEFIKNKIYKESKVLN